MKPARENPCRLLASEILRLVPCDRIAFAVPRPDGSGFQIAGAHPDDASFPDLVIPAQGSCTAHVIASRHGLLLSAIGEETHYAEEEALYRAGIRDAAFVPLFLGGEPMGVVVVGRTEVNSLEPRAVRCLEKVSGLLAAVLAAARDTPAFPAQPSGMVRHAFRISQEEESERACRGLLEAIREETPYRRAVLTLLDAERKGYQWFFTGLTEPEIEEFHRDSLDEVFATNRPARARGRAREKCHLPLFGFRERPLGFLSLDPAGGEAESAGTHRATVELMAALLSVTLERNQLLTELKRERNRLQKVQEQLVHSERLSAIGQLVSGVAHELNNPLAGVVGFAELVQRDNVNPKCERDLQRVLHEAQRCQHIVQNLLNFARRTKAERRAVDINEIVEDVLDLRSYQLRLDNVKVRRELAANLPRTAADYHQIQQVLLNVINNAHQAMLEVQTERILTLRTRASEGRILVQVEDTGPGIPPSRLGRVFDPFFTTKPAGKGTGLGLSLSRGIAREHGGEIRAESTLGRGTTFTFELPIREVTEERPALPPEAGTEAPTASRSVLVVDDEEVIVDLLNEVLVSEGHRVETTTDAQQALEKILSAGYDAVISDLKMPGMDGAGLYEAVCRQRPEMAARFVFSTGDMASAATQEFFRKTGCPCLVKPFDLNTVRATLDRLFSRS